MKKVMNKAYLITFTHGKRRVYELKKFKLKVNNLFELPYRTFEFSGNSFRAHAFNLLGKSKVKGKKVWNNFVEKLKVGTC